MITNLIVAAICYIIAVLIYKSLHASGENYTTFIVLDTETHALASDSTDITQDLRLVQLTAIKIDQEGTELARLSNIVSPQGFTIRSAATKIHGITMKKACQDGISINSILSDLERLLTETDVLISHNLEFDIGVLKNEFRIQNNDNGLKLIQQAQHVCTMRETKDLCQIPGRYGYKWPSLSELHEYLFGEEVKVIHNSDDDAEICLKCFKELYNTHKVLS